MSGRKVQVSLQTWTQGPSIYSRDSLSYGFGVMVYHVKGDPKENSFPRADVQPILFLSKLLNPAEKRCWPTLPSFKSPHWSGR